MLLHMVTGMVAIMGPTKKEIKIEFFLADILLHMVARTKKEKEFADIELDMVADMVADKVVDMVAGHWCWLIGPKLF